MTYTYEYPLLDEILKLYSDKKPLLDGVHILGCQHLLEPQGKMIEILNEYGIPKENIFMFGKIYSTSNEVLNEMTSKGFNISQPVFRTMRENLRQS